MRAGAGEERWEWTIRTDLTSYSKAIVQYHSVTIDASQSFCRYRLRYCEQGFPKIPCTLVSYEARRLLSGNRKSSFAIDARRFDSAAHELVHLDQCMTHHGL